MFKQLRFNDGATDKFWQIKVSGNSHTVTYGKTGTTGQTNTKKFDADELCLADAEKLIAEKLKKGYQDSANTTGTKKDGDTVSQAFYELVKNGDSKQIIPFMETYFPDNTALIKKEIKQAKQYWLKEMVLSENAGKKSSGYKTRGGQDQEHVIDLCALATFSLADANNWPELVRYLFAINDPDVISILIWRKPDWLGSFLATQITNLPVPPDYTLLRIMEEKGAFPFHPEAFAKTIAQYYDSQQQLTRSEECIQYILNDNVAYERDVPLLLQYETNMHVGTMLDFNNPHNHDASFWNKVFDGLLAENKIDRAFYITNLLAAQSKNWSNNLKSFLRKWLDQLQLSEQEILQHQDDFISMLQAERSSIASFGLDYLKKVMEHPDLKIDELLSSATPLFMRNDMKSSVKSFLGTLDAVAKKHPAYRSQLTQMAADAFVIPDLALHERITRFLVKHGAESDEALKEKLALYAPQMLGTCKTDLDKLLQGISINDSSPEAVEAYTYHSVSVLKLTDENKITIPDTWHDILFQVGKLINSKHPLDMEILMYCWTTKRDLFPVDYIGDLEPYTKMLDVYFNDSMTFTVFSNVFLNALFEPKHTHIEDQKVYEKSGYMTVWIQLLSKFLQLVRSKSRLPLLSAPTHHPFWLHPPALVERILAYEQTNTAIDLTDLAIAINRMPREQTITALELATQINNKEIKQLMLFVLKENTNWQQTLEMVRETDISFKGLWAGAARTFYPNEIIDVLGDDLKNIPFGREPLEPVIFLEPLYMPRRNFKTNEIESVFHSNQPSLRLPSANAFPNGFLYALDLTLETANRNYGIYHLSGSQDDVSFAYSIIPQNTAPLELFLIQGFFTGLGQTEVGADIVLNHLLTVHGNMTSSTHLYLATLLFTKDKITRDLAGETLIHIITANKVQPELIGKWIGELITLEYGSVSRLIEALNRARDVSPQHNDALYKLLQSALLYSELKDNLPADFKKIVVLFYELSAKLNRKPGDLLKDKLMDMDEFPVLSPTIKKLKKIG